MHFGFVSFENENCGIEAKGLARGVGFEEGFGEREGYGILSKNSIPTVVQYICTVPSLFI